jgi:GT2 family glycosyltransferase
MPLPIDIIVPFYRQPSLVKTLFDSLHGVHEELVECDCQIIAINDSPEDEELKAVLCHAVAELASLVPCRLIENPENLGFGRSVNEAAGWSVRNRHDVILLNSDTILFPGAVREMRRVAGLDPMIGFVSPRSNNATICSFPSQPEFQKLAPEESYSVFQELSRFLPDYHYVPVAVGFCLFISFHILDEFGLLDEIYGRGYNEENDLIMRANRCGYQAVLANHAFVYHLGEASFGSLKTSKKELEQRNSDVLHERYPEYPRTIDRYFKGTHYRAETMMSALLADSTGRWELVFDLSHLGTYHNGTFAAVKALLRAALVEWRKYFRIYACVSEEARRFHQLDKMEGLFFVSPDTAKTFALAFRFGQPFEYQHLARMSAMGVLNIFMMLDTIAMDCQYLNHLNLETLWGTVFGYADAVIYNSQFVQEQFRRRFHRRPGLKEMAAHHSLDLRDYCDPKNGASTAGSYILVVGNAFAHKYVSTTVDALSGAFPREKIVAFGIKEDKRHNVTAYQSGQLTDEQMHNLLRGAKLVVFPSHYEGFGIPVIESLAHSKPVLARSIPVLRELREKLPSRENLILYESTRDLVARLRAGIPQWQPAPAELNGTGPVSWASGTAEIGEFLRSLFDSWSFSEHLLPRLSYMRVLEDHRYALQGPLPAAIGKKEETTTAPESNKDKNIETALIQGLKAGIRDRDARIAELENSLSWRITAPLRTLGTLYLQMTGKQSFGRRQ